MKQLRHGAFLFLFIFGVGVSSGLADENPIDFKQSKNAWVVWAEDKGANFAVMASRWLGKKWEEPMVVSSNGHINVAPAVALDLEGNPWVVWNKRDGLDSSILSSHYDGEKWTKEELIAPVDDRENVTPAIAFDPKGNLLVAWGSVKGNSSDIKVRELLSENKWSDIITLTDPDDTPDMVPAVAITTEGKALVTWVGKEANYLSRLYVSSRDQNGKWSAEKLLDLGDPGFGEDLPTFKVEGETLKLYFEEGNRFFASYWTGKKWSRKKWVDLSNAYYDLFESLNGEPNGRAWFAWGNSKGKATSFRYDIATHDLALNSKSSSFHYISRGFKKGVESLGQIFAFVFGETEAFAGGKKKSKKPTKALRGAMGDSLTSGSAGVGWPPFWGDGVVQNVAKGGAKATGSMASQASGLSPDTKVVVVLGGTNDANSSLAIGDIVNGLNHVAQSAKNRAPGAKVFICDGVPRIAGNSGGVEELSIAIKSGSSFPVVKMFASLKGKVDAILIGDGLHLNETGAKTVGSIVGKRAR